MSRLLAVLLLVGSAMAQIPLGGITVSPSGGGGGHTLVSGFPLQALGTAAVTTAQNTTGATLIVIACAHTTATSCTIVDQANGTGANLNTWTSLTDYNSRNQFFYALNPTTNANHTFGTTAGGGPPSIQVWAFTGTFTAIDTPAQAGGSFSGSPPINIGSITPAQTGEVCVSDVSSNQSDPLTASANNGFSTAIIQHNASFELAAGAYILNSVNTAFNLQWSLGANTDWSGGIACWK